MAIYLDNAATSFPKPESVYRSIDETLRQFGGNPGRGGHQLALDASRIVFTAREAVAGFFGISDSSRVVFTANATAAINQALFGLLNPGDRVVTTNMEHNAVARPLRALQERGVEVVKVAADARGFVAPEDFCRACSAAPTALAVLGHISNVTGTIQDLPTIGPWCHSHGVTLLVDAAQSAGLLPIDVEALGIDLLAAPGHKGLFGPVGSGFLYVRPGLELVPLLYGGTGANSHSELMPEVMPERLESGTPNTPGLAGLTAGIAWLEEIGLDAIREHESRCLSRILSGLATISGLEIYGPGDPLKSGGVLSFNLKGLDPSAVAFRLDHEFSICVRSGLHCAPEAHRAIGTYPAGTVRVSPNMMNSLEEIEAFLTAIAVIAQGR
ncbi:MAG: aminotransferase class V-fold PLP-dependent enzyme [Desulfuromonadales bacterium]|nr:aminotransferase class V-fold PLP-dependent enzyme [Desulfuromonadales bacterium]